MINKIRWMRLHDRIRPIYLRLALVSVFVTLPFPPGVLPESTNSSAWDRVVGDIERGTPAAWQGVFEGDASATHLWVDAVDGDDGGHGLTRATAFRTIQKAADLAGPGATVHILPGVYRETVWPAMGGSAAEVVLYIAEDGPGTAIIRGSEPASSLNWTQLTANDIGLPPGVDPADIYYADLSAWELDGPPRFVVELNGSGEVAARLPLAREPDWDVVTEWKYHEYWWAADGGSDVAGCNPTSDPDPDCDYPWRSTTQVTDRTDDVEPAGVEPGNLSTLGDLTGATLVAIDTRQGHYVYRRTIVTHDVSTGRVTVDEICEHDSGSGTPGLGWGSKYYVEGAPYLMDTPGEWWYDEGGGRLYLWPRTAGDPATTGIEISRREDGFRLTNRSYITLDGLTIEFFNENAVSQDNVHTQKSHYNTVRNVTLRHANRGVRLRQTVRADAPVDNVTDGFTLEDSEIGYIDTHAIHVTDWWENRAAPDSFIRSGVFNTTIRNNELHDLGFRTDEDDANGAMFVFAHRLRFEGNHVHHVAHNGIQFSRSVIQSPNDWGFTPDEIKTGEILIQGNLFEKTCQLTTDCGALKFWGKAPDNHVFREVLITGNIFRNTFGWAYVSQKRGGWSGGVGSGVQGMGGKGLVLDMASGVHVYRNIAYNNASAGFMIYGLWRDGDIVYYNNVAANSLYGFSLGGLDSDLHGSVNTQVVDNIVVNNEGYGIVLSDADGDYGNLLLDHNLYNGNGWRAYEDGGSWKPGAMVVYRGADPNKYYPTLADIQANTPWETHGVAGDPSFWDYDPDDHDLHDGSWPDFHLTAESNNAIDRGTTALPDSLVRLLDHFEVQDPHWGQAFDIGRYEAGFGISATPAIQGMDAGGVAHYALRLVPDDLPHNVTLNATSPSPDLGITITPTVLGPGDVATLSVTDTGSTGAAGSWYTIRVKGTGGGFTRTTSVQLIVGGKPIYLPLMVQGFSP
jgi:hypothetical protein